MTQLLDRALQAALSLPPAVQDEIARIVLQLAGADDTGPPIALTPEEHAAILASKAAAARGDFATEDEVHALRTKYGG